MPYTEFHYTPTGTGVISGKEVLEQTEDAINDLGGQISGDVQTAIDTANNALNTANTASADAQNAVNTANTAYTAATNAQNTANTAQNTASNALTAAQNAQNDVNALGNRVTTAENNISQNTSDISGLTTRMGTAEGNITTLQNDVITAQGTATSAQNTATLARGQAYVVRYASVAVSDNSTVPYTDLNNVDNIKANDLLLDINGKFYQITSVDTSNETVSVTTPLTQLAVDSDVVHKSGNETINGNKTFGKGTLIVDNGVGSNVHGEIKFNGSRPGYIVADNASDGVFDNAGCGISILLQDAEKPLHIGVYKTDSNGRVFVDNTNKNPVLTITGSLIKSSILIPENDSSNNYVKILSELNYANGNPSKTLDVRFVQYDNANATSGIYSNNDGKTSLGVSSRKWSDVVTYKVNGVEPSSLSLPDYSRRIDISGYVTNLNGGYNAYIPSVDGWITIRSSDATFIRIADTGSGGLGNTATSQTAGILTCMIPVRANRQNNIYIVCTTLTSAYFIPCQGNV